MKVLLTGASGMIGRASVRLLAARGHEVLATDVRALPAEIASTPFSRLDVRRGETVRATFARAQPDAVVHLAARHFIPWCERHRAATLHTNVVGTQNVIEGARRAGVARLVFSSSAAVYAPSGELLREDSRLVPDDIYGASKLMGEQLLGLVGSQGAGASTVVLRLFNTIGPGDPNPHLLPRILGELRAGSGGLRLGNLASVRDYVYVEDVARAVLAAVERELPALSVANVGTGEGRSVEEVVQTLGSLIGCPLRIVSTASQRRAVDRPFLVADRARAAVLLDWEPEVRFADALARTLSAAGVDLADAAEISRHGPERSLGSDVAVAA